MLQSLFDHFSSSLYPYFWKYRHLWSKGWPESYLSDESVNQIHRRLLCEAIEKLEPFWNIHEYGCGPGANLLWFTRQFPHAKIFGYDVSGAAIFEAAKTFYFSEKVHLVRTSKLEPKGEIDVLVTDACLIYDKNPSEMFSIAMQFMNNGYVGCEWHADCDKSFTYGRHWVHNFKKLLPGCELRKLTWNDWPDDGWSTYGHIITWRK